MIKIRKITNSPKNCKDCKAIIHCCCSVSKKIYKTHIGNNICLNYCSRKVCKIGKFIIFY